MRFLPLLAALACCAAHAQTVPTATWKLAPYGSTDKLLASARGRLDPWKPVPIQLDCVRGENANFQFVVSAGARPIESLSVAPTTLATFDGQFIRADAFELFRENYVFVAHPSGNRSATPKWWPDALVPLALARPKIETGQSAVFWACVRIPDDAPPGDYFGELDVLCNDEPRRLALTITVRPIALPPSKFRGTVALYYEALRDWYHKDGREFFDAQWAEQKQRYSDFLLRFGLNPYDPPVAWTDPAIDSYLNNPRVHSVRTPSLDSPDFAPALQAFGRTKTKAKAFYYWNDEPSTPEQFAAIKSNSIKLRALGVPQLVTAHPTPALKQSVDIWCPNISNALGSGHLDIPELRREQLAHHPTWLYTMVVPRHPYPTWLLDDDSSAVLSFAPLWNRVGASGFVYSMAHGWGPHPLDDLTSFQGTNGDGTLLYPAELVGGVGPMPSIRLLLLRDAIEDLALWNEATKREIAPDFSFPVQRSGALIYNRTPLLDALESGNAPAKSATNEPHLWPDKPTQTTFHSPFVRPLGVGRRVELRLKGTQLEVRLIGLQLQKDEELVAVLAPVEVAQSTERWRFSRSVEGYLSTNAPLTQRRYHTYPEQMRMRLLAVKPAVLLLDVGASKVRFNILLRSPRGTTRLFFDGNDPFLMPTLQQSQAKAR